LQKLRKGILVKKHNTLPCQAERIREPELPPRRKPITPHKVTSWVRIILSEGKKRQIRHMTAAVGFPTLRLIRVAIGPLNLQNLDPGEWRHLTQEEIRLLKFVLKINPTV